MVYEFAKVLCIETQLSHVRCFLCSGMGCAYLDMVDKDGCEDSCFQIPPRPGLILFQILQFSPGASVMC